MKGLLGVACLLACGSTCELACAQTLSRQESQSTVEEAERLIGQRFVSVPDRQPVVAALRTRLASGRYDVTEPVELAQRMTTDLQSASRDKHLGVEWDPARHAALRQQKQNGNEGAAAAIAAGQARRSNHGLTDFRVLAGNVRYLRITGFHWIPDETGGALDAAMHMLRGGAAVIIDVRGNGGGNSEAVRYAISHFLPADREQLLMTVGNERGEPVQSWALSYLPKGRLTVPLYVLVDERTNSAAEEFVYHVKQFKLGTIIGARTRGGGRNNAHFPIGSGFVLSLSVFEPAHAIGGGSWEGVGIQPDVGEEPRRALERAHLAALEMLSTKAHAPDPNLDWALLGARAALEPPRNDPRSLRAFAGNYGERRVEYRDGKLVYARRGQPAAELRPITTNVFALSTTDEVRIRFEDRALRVLYADGTGLTARKD